MPGPVIPAKAPRPRCLAVYLCRDEVRRDDHRTPSGAVRAAIDEVKAVLGDGPSLLRPVFAANHKWPMARGEQSLRLELRRRRARSDREGRHRATQPPARLSLTLRDGVGARAAGQGAPHGPTCCTESYMG
jgi:hypothetical protein